MSLKVVVSGAGIAGLALAHWLGRIGASAVVVEREPTFQALGHYISLKGNGVDMIRRMGILDACRERAAPIDETRVYTSLGRFLRAERTAALASTLGGYMLLRRADLQAALYDVARERADIRFGAEIAAARCGPDGVEVVLADGRIERADLLVGADGIHSRVRDLVFGRGFERPLGGHYIAVTQALRHGLPLSTHAYMGDGRMVNLFPVAPGSVSAVVYVGEGGTPPPRHGARGMREYLLETCAAFPDDVRRVFGAISGADFVFTDIIAQVEMPRITSGCCALLGDAAHCPTFLSGMGSSLALQDACVFAGCLARQRGDVSAALRSYEAIVTPIARRYRNGALTARGAILGRGRARTRLRNLVVRLTPERVLQLGLRRFIDAERPLPDIAAS